MKEERNSISERGNSLGDGPEEGRNACFQADGRLICRERGTGDEAGEEARGCPHKAPQALL